MAIQAREGSKRRNAIDVMLANRDKSMADVVKLIAAKNGDSEGTARSYYKWICENYGPCEDGGVIGSYTYKRGASATPAEVDPLEGQSVVDEIAESVASATTEEEAAVGRANALDEIRASADRA